MVDCGHDFNSLGSARLDITGGVKVHPLTSHSRTRKLNNGLIRVGPYRHCTVSSLARSVPFLVPRTDTLLSAVKTGFLSSLDYGKLGPGRVVIASMLHATSSIGHLHHHGKGTSTGSTRTFKAAFSIDCHQFYGIRSPSKHPVRSIDPSALGLMLTRMLHSLQGSSGYCVGCRLGRKYFRVATH